MTPKEKAKELYDKMEFHIKCNAQPSTVYGIAKQCALIAVDELIEQEISILASYWREVKTEINKL